MDGNHPQNIDPRPKRRKDRDNPYSIFSIGKDSNDPHFYLSFTDGQGVYNCMEITEEQFEIMNRFELDDLSFLNEVDNHYDLKTHTLDFLHTIPQKTYNDPEELVYHNQRIIALHQAMDTLPELQRRRLVLYYYGEYTMHEIAQMEGCCEMCISKSIKRAIAHLREIMINYDNRG